MKKKFYGLVLCTLSFCHVFASELDVGIDRKRPREEGLGQIYAIATYDAAFKWVLSDDTIRPSFFHAFIPGLSIQSSERLDDHMNPLRDLQLLRDFLHDKDTNNIVSELSKKKEEFAVGALKDEEGDLTYHEKSTNFLREMISRFDDIKRAFPKIRYNGTMDFVCKLENNDYAMVEMQVIPQDHWDRRALAYVAAFYGNQLRKGQQWKDIKKVIGINILGGGKDNIPHWSDTPDQFVRHYKFQEQLHNHEMFIDGIELLQYSIMNAPKTLDAGEKEKQDWITFLKRGHYMNEEEVNKTITTKAVLDAFERAKIDKLPLEVQEAYAAEDTEYERFSQFTKEKKDEGIKEGKAEGIKEGEVKEQEKRIKKMMIQGKTDGDILEIFDDISKERIKQIRDSLTTQ